ncbi:MAG: PAS domain S-box protein [Burkholderiaceae bacterium]
MWLSHPLPGTVANRAPRKHGWRLALPLLPALLVLVVLLSLVWLPWKAQQLESAGRKEQLIADTLWVERSIRLQLARNEESLRMVAAEITSGKLVPRDLPARLAPLLERSHEITRVTWYDADARLEATAVHLPSESPVMSDLSREAVESGRRTGVARYSAPVLPPSPERTALMDYHLPLVDPTQYRGSLITTYSIATMLKEMVPWWFALDNEVTLTGGDDNVIERLSVGGPGHGVYTHAHALDLPGANLTLRTNSLKTAPKLLPNLLVASVIALSLALFASLVALWRDINRRLGVESALRQQVSFRTAMENSLVTGLRARDLEGRVSYVNPAFCHMVGTPASDLLGRVPPMPYWAPEAMAEYQKRFAEVLAGTVTPRGFETIFQRADGERFPVLIFESPLLDDTGRQTGWMGSILDISERKAIEELTRQQQETLELSARMASMGEIASTLAHELNQPLAAISSYTTGAMNMLDHSVAASTCGSAVCKTQMDVSSLRTALEKASAQAHRAGQIIRSVQAFVKQRASAREPISVRALIEGVAPLIELQAHKYFVVVRLSIEPNLPPVLADRLLMEQVLLNLTRNAIEAMETITPSQRVLRIHATLDAADAAPSVRICVMDRGHGIAPEVAGRLFSPFFSTKAEGMGMGLNICRTTIEFHGGQLHYRANAGGGTVFEFGLPVSVGGTPLAAPVPASTGPDAGTRF